MKPNRLARGTFRIGLAVCVVIAAAWWVSYWRLLNVAIAGWMVGLDCGSVYVFDNRIVQFVPSRAWTYGPVTKMDVTANGVSVMVHIFPTWLFLSLALIPTVLAWRRLRRPLPGHCTRCGYNLTGNVTGKCSECGTKIQCDK